jgi:hypothetical protein
MRLPRRWSIFSAESRSSAGKLDWEKHCAEADEADIARVIESGEMRWTAALAPLMP